MAKPTEGVQPIVGVGQPGWKTLNLFGLLVRQAFPGARVYLVGSAAVSKTWRDVDVRAVVTERQWRRYVGEPGERSGAHYSDTVSNAYPTGRRRSALELAFCALAKKLTGLPVDFQFMSEENAAGYSEERRWSLGLEVENP